MPKFLKNIIKFTNIKDSAAYSVERSFLDKSGLSILIKKILNSFNKIYPQGIVIELKCNIDPHIAIGGDWKDVTSNYSNTNPNTKKWQRIIPVDSNKKELQNSYNQYINLDSTKYIESTWIPFAEELEKAKAVLEDLEATQAEVDDANTALLIAYIGLRLKPTN